MKPWEEPEVVAIRDRMYAAPSGQRRTRYCRVPLKSVVGRRPEWRAEIYSDSRFQKQYCNTLETARQLVELPESKLAYEQWFNSFQQAQNEHREVDAKGFSYYKWPMGFFEEWQAKKPDTIYSAKALTTEGILFCLRARYGYYLELCTPEKLLMILRMPKGERWDNRELAITKVYRAVRDTRPDLLRGQHV